MRVSVSAGEKNFNWTFLEKELLREIWKIPSLDFFFFCNFSLSVVYVHL